VEPELLCLGYARFCSGRCRNLNLWNKGLGTYKNTQCYFLVKECEASDCRFSYFECELMKYIIFKNVHSDGMVG
jgi:hypothetical protein